MSFTSINFIVFIVVVVVMNYIIPRTKRWLFLLAASYYFYLNWQPIYGLLLLGTSVITYLSALLMGDEGKPKRYRKWICAVGCVLPLASLGLFKYYNFITSSIHGVLSSLGVLIEMPRFDLLMPIGISFYTFTAVGYLIDIYRKQYEVERNFFMLSLFIGFFAQIASGPIPRGSHLLPQLRSPENLSYDNVIGGLRTMIWGFFMKLCVADRLGIYVDTIYGNITEHNGGSLFLASLLYTIQIYCDFAGYSLVAIGAARMLGIRLMDNFRRPYFSTSLKEFWCRWHISLSSWFRDYVYIPLGGSRVSKPKHIFNLIATFLVSGLWHGAAWNFLLWGGLHGVGQSVEKMASRGTKKKMDVSSFNPFSLVKVFLVFLSVNFLWVFFRLESVNHLHIFFVKLCTDLGMPFVDMTLVYGGVAVLLLFIKDLIDEYWPGIKFMNSNNIVVSNCATGLLVAVILLFGVFDSSSFIYFQF